MTVGLTHRTYWCISTYVTITLTLLNLDRLAFEWWFFPRLMFLDGSKTKKLQIIWLSYGIISGDLASSGMNFLNLNSLSQKATKMSKKPSVTHLLWQSLSSSVLCLILWNLSDKPMIPFMYEDLKDLFSRLLELFVKPAILEKNKTGKKMMKLDLYDNEILFKCWENKCGICCCCWKRVKWFKKER